MHFCVRQIKRPAEDVAELVVQSHLRAAYLLVKLSQSIIVLWGILLGYTIASQNMVRRNFRK